MKIVFTRHAYQRMGERNIARKEIEEAICDPYRCGLQENRRFAMKTRKNGHILIVYYMEVHGVCKVITVITTSKVFKYLK